MNYKKLHIDNIVLYAIMIIGFFIIFSLLGKESSTTQTDNKKIAVSNTIKTNATIDSSLETTSAISSEIAETSTSIEESENSTMLVEDVPVQEETYPEINQEITSSTTNDEPVISNASTYILNTNTMKFHKSGCSSVSKMNESNKSYYEGTRDEVISMGYSPCQRCNP